MTCVWEITLECKKRGTATQDGLTDVNTFHVVAGTCLEAITKAADRQTGYLSVAVRSAKRLYDQVIE